MDGDYRAVKRAAVLFGVRQDPTLSPS
jgi:hypothetical protein